MFANLINYRFIFTNDVLALVDDVYVTRVNLIGYLLDPGKFRDAENHNFYV